MAEDILIPLGGVMLFGVRKRPLDIRQRVEIAGGLVAAGVLVYLSSLG